MKYYFLFWFLMISATSFSQREALVNMLSERNKPDCEKITPEIMEQITEKFISGKYSKIDSLLNILDFFCGKCESTERVIIFNAILNKSLEKKNIDTYIKRQFINVLEYRKRDAKSANYLTEFNENKEYFGYLPLRHPIDSIITSKSKELLDNNLVSGDDKLFCILFAHNKREFSQELSKNEYKKSHVRAVTNEIKYQNSRNEHSFSIYLGGHSMIGNNNKIFGNNHYIGFSFCTPLKNKIIADFGMNIRYNINDSDFQFYAMGDTNTVNSKTTLLFYSKIGFKIYDKNKIIIIPHLGVGFETTGTGLKELIESDEEDFYKYHNLNALNLSAGITVLRPLFVRNYIGLSLNYHYCPYYWNEKLITKFNNNSVSCELLFRF